MTRQKRIAVINDMSGFGRCSVSVSQPIISAMKIQACVMPTAILSAHTGFDGYVLTDYTEHMRAYMKNWKDLGLEFDGILTGFLGSEEQIEIVIEFIKMFAKENTTVVVDPVMGDYGRIYPSYTDKLCEEMKRLLPFADVLTPNLTEACRLLDMDYHTTKTDEKSLEEICKKLSDKGPDRIVITGLNDKDTINNFIYEKGKRGLFISAEKVGEDRSGTGDVFASIIGASLVNGESFECAVKKAVDFVHKTLEFTVALDTPVHDGLCFEEYLSELR